jgi:hypothetical protein
MPGEQFDSGGVLDRARPVLTFASVVREQAPPPTRARADTPTPPPVSWGGLLPSRRNDLPVIPRIVRRTRIEQGMILGPLARAALTVRRAGLGTLLFAALGLATLATIAGLGLRSLPDDVSIPPVSGEARVFDATATERLLARAPLAPRADAPVPRVAPPPVPPAPRAAAVAVRARAAPSHTAFAAAHAAKKHPSSTVLARR